jgi:hypothetical protein
MEVSVELPLSSVYETLRVSLPVITGEPTFVVKAGQLSYEVL